MTTTQKLIGALAVETGQLLIGDPCTLQGPLDAAQDNVLRGKTHCTFEAGSGADAALIVATGYGDGLYPVYAEIRDGRVMRLTIDFTPDPKQGA
jgi:hypothetical protein